MSRLKLTAMTVLVWFKRDLRVTDHPALCWAVAQGGGIVPVYVVEPEYWQEPDTSARQFQFMIECVEHLRGALRALGSDLVVQVGAAEDCLARIAAQHKITQMVSHEETGNAWTFARDKRVAHWAREAGLSWHEVPQCAVQRRLANRDGWAARRETFVRAPQAEKITALPPIPDQGHRLPTARELSLTADACPDRQPGGRAQALSLLGSFLTERGQTYRAAMSSPVEGEWACSRLSPYIALGAVSVREVAQAAAARKAELKGTRSGWLGSMRSFSSRLAWRDHFIQKLEDAPSIEHRVMHSAYEGLRPQQTDPARLNAWVTGETGVPFVDACMRYLNATGWINFRMRSMLMAVASYHLWLDWRPTGLHLARQFTDYEPGIHWSQVQMQSGTTGMNTVRVYNPVKQGKDQDPSGAFTRRWVPELAPVPDQFLQEPWLWKEAGRVLGKTYPEPIVDVLAAAREASAKVWAVRRGDAFRHETAGLVKKHASRKSGAGGKQFVNDRAPRKKRSAPPDQRQLPLDL